jgi:hypothetical protein
MPAGPVCAAGVVSGPGVDRTWGGWSSDVRCPVSDVVSGVDRPESADGGGVMSCKPARVVTVCGAGPERTASQTEAAIRITAMLASASRQRNPAEAGSHET